MDGVLVVDKPAGLTSHDVVAAARRLLRERRIGHTGTLDPLATGVLPLACGVATRLVRFFTASDKDYEATIRFGRTTDTYDVTGTVTGGSGRVPDREAVARAVEELTGDYAQVPPPYSAKKLAGRRAYELARAREAVELAPVPVRVARAEIVAFTGGTATVALTCSAGFYVRSFAHRLGELIGTGACLEALRRTRSGRFTVDHAVALDALGDAETVRERLVGLDRLLLDLPGLHLTADGVRRVAHGQDVGPAQLAAGPPATADHGAAPDAGAWTRLLDEEGRLVAMAMRQPASGLLHPSVVLI